MLWLVRFFVTEAVASFFFVLLACAGQVGKNPESDFVAVGTITGLSGMVVFQIFGFLSGALLDPALTVASVVNGSLDAVKGATFVVAQVSGATLAYFALIQLLGEDAVTGAKLCFAEPSSDLDDNQIIAVQFLISFLYIFGLFAMLDCRNRVDASPMRFGFILATCVFFGIMHTGYSFNSAIMVASSIANDNYEKLHILAAGQCAAAIVAPFVWRFLFTN